ncbi:unnamed protein product [Orchesella dallaii]|uniref:Uncharacterized protein n=1 Tax=Orchesella dallaii TaxID=48710 RepID=A0ABP1QEH4_9HEXA
MRLFNNGVSSNFTNRKMYYSILLLIAASSVCNCGILRELNLSENANMLDYNESVSKCPLRSGKNSSKYIECSDVVGDQVELDLTDDGYLKMGENYMAPGEFCISGKSAKLCPDHSNVTWRKCCPKNQVVDGRNPQTCVNYSRPFRPLVNGKLLSFHVNSHIANFQCPNGYHRKKLFRSLCSSRAMTRFELTSNGTLLYEVATGVFLRKSNWNVLDHKQDHYCIDGVINHPVSDCSLQQKPVKINNSISDTLYSYNECQQHEQMAVVLFVCIPNQHSDEDINEKVTEKTTLLAVIWSLTTPLLLGAALVNSFVIQKNVHGWILTCYLLSMCTLNILSVIFICDPGHHYEGCRTIDFIIKFMYMSTLCWMTSINFGLWKTFRYTLPQAVGLRRFTASVLFSCGFPAISVTACYYVAYHGTDERCKAEYCLLYSYSTIPFYSIPMFLLVLMNFGIFVKTSYTITKLRKEAEDVLRRQAQDHLESFALFAKLFLLTGCIWLIRLVLFILQVQGRYLSWYGVMLEVIFCLPEAVFPVIVFHHKEFIKWSWIKYPRVSRQEPAISLIGIRNGKWKHSTSYGQRKPQEANRTQYFRSVVTIRSLFKYNKVDRTANVRDKYSKSASQCPTSSEGNSSDYTDCSNVIGQHIKLDLTDDGYLKMGENYIASNEFCISGKSAKLCPEHSNVTWRKCCPKNQVVDGRSPQTCVNYSRPFRPLVNGKLLSFHVNSHTANFQCPNGFHIKKLLRSLCSSRAMTRFDLTSDGTLLYEVAAGVFLRKSNWKKLNHKHDHYCIDGVISHKVSNCDLQRKSVKVNMTISDTINIYNECRQDVVLFVCISNEHSEEDTYEKVTVKTTLLAVTWSFTAPLLLGAALVNSFVIQKNVHGWILTCYLLSMCTLNILSVIIICDPGHNHGGCRPIDFIFKFMYMSTLCWMTSINFGLWKTFRYTLPQAVGLRRFTTSALFSCGIPAISVTTCYYVAYHGTDERCKTEYCLLYSYNTIPFYSIPIFLLVLGNFAIFIKTSYTIIRRRKEAENVLRRQAHQDHIESFALFAKLFLLTGGIWLIRLILFILVIQGLYLSWYGVMLEVIFSLPEVIFPIIVFHHKEFIKWSWMKYPRASRLILQLDPYFQVSTSK